MARLPQVGTSKTTRSTNPVDAKRNRALLFVSLFAGACVVAVALGLYAVGARQTLSPGNVAAPHFRIDLKCAQCHASGKEVEAARCERCHDPAAAGRLSHAAHVLAGTGDRQSASKAAALNCSQCHTDHQGRNAVMRHVSDLECASCHEFRSFASHPEFAALNVKAEDATPALEFDHARHVTEAEQTQGAACETCHEQTPDRRGFQPIAFDRHCASCHTKGGLLTGDTDFVPPEMLIRPGDLPPDILGASRPELETNPRGRHKATRLRHRDEWVLFNAARLRRGIDPEGDEIERGELQSRISYLELLQTAPGVHLVPRQERDAAIAVLRDELKVLNAGPVTASANGEAALAQIAQAARGLDAALPQGPAQVPAGDFETRRADLLRLLEAVEARLGAAGRVRVAALRERVLALREGSSGADENETLRQDRQRKLDHLLIAKELDQSPRDREDAPSQDASRDRAGLERRLRVLRARLADLNRIPDMEAPASDAVREGRVGGLESLLTPCRKCHNLDESSSGLAPVARSGPILRQAMFNHAPHTINVRCESCHTAARTSKTSHERLIPGVASCQKCHQGSQVTATCATCHAYHPRSPASVAAAQP